MTLPTAAWMVTRTERNRPGWSLNSAVHGGSCYPKTGNRLGAGKGLIQQPGQNRPVGTSIGGGWMALTCQCDSMLVSPAAPDEK